LRQNLPSAITTKIEIDHLNTSDPKQIASPQQFGSDNYAGICPEVMAAMQRDNSGHVVSYGDDSYTATACDAIRSLFNTNCEVYFVFNGTAANALCLASMCQGHHAVICQGQAHIKVDECGAPGFFTHGARTLCAPGVNGKLTPAEVSKLAVRRKDDIHCHKPQALSLTQATECGTVYTVAEIKALTRTAKQHQLFTHMDGARFANAVAHLNCKPEDITYRVDIDALSFGGTKNGLGVGEAVVFFNHDLADDFAWRCKQSGQLCSKMRTLSSQWLGLLENDTWLRNATRANNMATYLAEGIQSKTNLTLNYPCQANAVFVDLPAITKSKLHQRGWHFYDVNGAGSRLMCAWDTKIETVDSFLIDLEAALA
jgi:threonine aldolase